VDIVALQRRFVIVAVSVKLKPFEAVHDVRLQLLALTMGVDHHVRRRLGHVVSRVRSTHAVADIAVLEPTFLLLRYEERVKPKVK